MSLCTSHKHYTLHKQYVHCCLLKGRLVASPFCCASTVAAALYTLLLLQEVEAARTIAERGVVLIGTAHGNSLSNLMRNPVLRPLVGGMQAVTLGDEMARRTNSSVKVRHAFWGCQAAQSCSQA